MGRTTTPKYSVTVSDGRYAWTPMGWDGRRYGTPTDASLARYVADMNASFAPGGSNAHLGVTGLVAATVRHNVANGAPVARWSAFVPCTIPDCGLSASLGRPVTPHSHPRAVS